MEPETSATPLFCLGTHPFLNVLQANIRQEGTVFVELMLGQYNTYLSRKFAHVGWYVGIKKNGRQKSGHKTAWGQKAIQFLPIRV